MNEAELKRRYPNASASFLRANAGGKTPGPVTKRSVQVNPLGQAPVEEGYSTRFRVSITSYRRRLLDPDNTFVKPFVDCLRYANIIKDDRSADIELVIGQEKVLSKESEHTLITVEKI